MSDWSAEVYCERLKPCPSCGKPMIRAGYLMLEGQRSWQYLPTECRCFTSFSESETKPSIKCIKVSRPAFRYHGGKWMIAEKIIDLFPPHISYVDPFGGAGSVLMRKPPSPIETYNDLDKSVVGFFRVLRERPVDLLRVLSLTPYSREEFHLSYEPATDELEAARRFYVRIVQGRARSSGAQRTGWRYLTNDTSGALTATFANNKHLLEIVERLKAVQIESDDALAVIRRFDTPKTLFYVDPPYVLSTRTTGAAYSHEMSDDQHRELAAVLRNVKGMVILSGYPCDLYDELYGDWQTRILPSYADNTDGLREEYVWISPNAHDQFASPIQMTMEMFA